MVNKYLSEVIDKQEQLIRALANDTLLDYCTIDDIDMRCLFDKERMIFRLPYQTIINAGDTIHHQKENYKVIRVSKTTVLIFALVEIIIYT